jgi:hypothetical protein
MTPVTLAGIVYFPALPRKIDALFRNHHCALSGGFPMQGTSTMTGDERVSLPVRIGGRVYPLEFSASGAGETTVTAETAKANTVRRQLFRLITDRLSYFSSTRPRSTSELTEVYVDSLQALERFRQDVQDLIPHLCEANLTFRQESGTTAEKARNEVLAQKLSEMTAKTRLDIRRAKNVVDADLLALPAEQADERLRASLEDNVECFVADFFDALDQLVDQQIAGLVEWTGQNACRYHFFREVVIQDHESTKRMSNGRRQSSASPTGWVERINTTTRGTHTHRMARHEHHTTDAFHTSIDDSQVVMPPAVRKLVDNIPEWLAPIVRVIDGKLAREIVIERDIKKESWEQNEPEDIPVFGCEPAVVIDHIVLTGWGPRDIDAELARRNEQTQLQKQATERRKATLVAPACWTLGCCFSVLSLWLFWQSSTPTALGAAFAVLLVAVPCWISAFMYSAIATEQSLAKFRPLLGSLGITAVLLGVGLMLAFGFGSVAIVLTSVVLAIGGISILMSTRPRTPSQLERQANEFWTSI